MDPPPLCLFCLEELKQTERCPNLVGCGCAMDCHARCLDDWFQQKGQMECPICHRISVPNPITASRRQEIVIVHIQDPQVEEHRRTLRAQEKCVGACCFGLLFWWVFSLIIEYAL